MTMGDTASVIGFELIVDDLDRAIALWTEVLGFQLTERKPSTLVAGELAIVTDQRVAVSLLRPADAGPGHLLADRTPRLSQIVFTIDEHAAESSQLRATEAGLSVTASAAGYYLSPESVEGALGIEAAFVVTHDTNNGPDTDG